MLGLKSPLTELREELASGAETPMSVARECLARANGNASRNTYVWMDEGWLLDEAAELERSFAGSDRPALYGVPVSLKDCFDLAGTVTTAGSRFYAERSPVAVADSAVAGRARSAGMLITGKTHLHPLAYGITGESPDFGDCVQPRDAGLLTGGSSSGAVASVQEGSALVGIGTDTGGSVRVPAALCGLAGYRMSHRLAFEAGRWGASIDGLWAGGVHLSQTFDTVGIFVRDPRDLGDAADGLFGVGVEALEGRPRVGCVAGGFLDDCDSGVLDGLRLWRDQMVRAGAEVEEFDPGWWVGAQEVFSGIQAHEAAEIHKGNYDAFEQAIAERLRGGAGMSGAAVAALRGRMEEFRARLMQYFERWDFVMLPCAPVRRLAVGEDHRAARQIILKYTAPFSLGGLPAIALPGEMVGGALGSGVQIAAPPGKDAKLLGWAKELGERLAEKKA